VTAGTLYTRNWLFVDSETQQRLEHTVVFAAGVGGTSHTVQLACRTGVGRFIIADHDSVELSNLNRQGYGTEHLGRNKARALADSIRSIRSDAELEIIDRAIDEHNFRDPMLRSDVVINSIDFDEAAFLQLNREAQAAGKLVLLPLHLGWTGVVLAFTSQSPTLDEFLDLPAEYEASDVATTLVRRVVAQLSPATQRALAQPIEQFAARDADWPGDPQLGAAVYATAALSVAALVAWVSGHPVRTVPDVVYTDLAGGTTGPLVAT
jgi:hypothetical protein